MEEKMATIDTKIKPIPDDKRLICRVPEQMAKDFMMNCKEEGETMSVVIRQLIRAYNAAQLKK
jgi:hypothetical protein